VDENGQLRSVVKFEEDSPPALREIFRAATEGYDDEYGPPCFFFPTYQHLWGSEIGRRMDVG